MPVLSGVAFGVSIPYIGSIKRTRRPDYQSHQRPTPRPTRMTSFSDLDARAAYKPNRASRLINQYKLYNKTVDTPTVGTIISLDF